MRRRAALGRLALCLGLLGLLALAGVVACGGGGGGGGPTQPPPPPPPPPPSITFTPAAAPAANSIFLTSSAASTASKLFLEVRANQVTDLYGVAFDLSYPTAVLRYDNAVRGNFLDGTIAVSETPAGNLVVGVTRLGAVQGVDGSGLLLTLELSPVAAGSGNFTFSRNAALDDDGAQMTATGWVAGSVQVVR